MAKGKAWSSCRRGHGGGARSGKRHVTTIKLEEIATMDKHGATARFSLWKFCLLMGDSSGEAQKEAKSAGSKGWELMVWCLQKLYHPYFFRHWKPYLSLFPSKGGL